MLSHFYKLPSTVHAFGEALFFISINVVGDVGCGDAFLDTDVRKVFEKVDLLHLVISKDGFALFFSTEHGDFGL